MNIAIIGYGGMGKDIEKIALARGINVKSIIDPIAKGAMHKDISKESMDGVDIAIDFTHPSVVVGNIKKVSSFGVSMVVGTTGWYANLEEIKNIVKKSGIGFMYGSNFSVGVHAYYKIIEEAARIFNKIPDYDIWGHEIHHFRKADSPSGTAKSVADILLKNIDRKKKVVYDKLDRRREDDEIHFSSVRGGPVNFEHVIGFDSDADTITIRHAARHRGGYALGAIMAAEWMKGKKGFFVVDDFIKELLG
ncbi:MAG: 4-hydroxy-tetrahydrodipicolinate reductase [Nanoarchaeota archaeon]